MKIDTEGKRFAVIVDEAHSSQSGETATTLRGMLNKEGIEAAIVAQLCEEEDDDLSDETKAAVLRGALQRARQPNLRLLCFYSYARNSRRRPCSMNQDHRVHHPSTSTPCGKP